MSKIEYEWEIKLDKNDSFLSLIKSILIQNKIVQEQTEYENFLNWIDFKVN